MTALTDVTTSGATGGVGPRVVAMAGATVLRGGARILGPLDWTVRDGERWVVLGANGAGKTTLLQLCAAAIVPTGGAVELLGEDLDDPDADLDELQPRVGWMSAALADQLPPSTPALDVVLTGLHASLRRGTETYSAGEQARASALLARVGGRSLAPRAYGSLSEGERKRVQLARALLPEPELLLLDEPAAGLDLGGREALVRLLTRLATDPAIPAMVMVSHHVEELPTGMTHALLLRDGAAVAAGPVEDVMTSRALTATFGVPLVLTGFDGRWFARTMLPRVG